MTEGQTVEKEAADHVSTLLRTGPRSSHAHYRGMNMHENTEIRREAQRISWPEKPRFIVIPAGVAFYHVADSSTGRVKGFRRRHQDACELARHLEG
ncbi:hypothetical protein KSS94_17815 [Pseudomonas fakonensis]|uniref:Uncharacterized protein n=1 Tax=Pseudomonas fakonensis TaxID=2842355 RepID=A0ABX8N092_9PSED|nr:hypothetical protein [Pseudomonas fakonensis]QXH49792.1 hypothetical protein KSS94_17815 [Pseudomonas fakonensis]